MNRNDARRDAADGSPAEEGAALAAVTALMDERRRYEGWISALEARRAATADHVFARVHLDYSTRLEAVIVKLSSHADALRGELATLEARLEALTSEHQRGQDERAEAELRAHVGELSADDWQRMATERDSALDEVATRRGAVERELGRTRELLESATPPTSVPAQAPAPKPAPPEAPPAAPPTAAPVAERKSRPVAAPTSAPPAAQDDAALPAELPPAVIAAEQQLLDMELKPPRPSTGATRPAPAPHMPETDVPPAASRRATGFDELAFLSSVVDTPSGTFDAAPADQPDEKARLDTFAQRSQEDQIVHLAEGTTPLSSPIVHKAGEPLLSGGGGMLRRDSASDGVKSLKCGECGAMNYPTEWYCERCGAELASL
ncbi:MAG: hypothetical protein ABJA80_17970 [bacterium]